MVTLKSFNKRLNKIISEECRKDMKHQLHATKAKLRNRGGFKMRPCSQFEKKLDKEGTIWF